MPGRIRQKWRPSLALVLGGVLGLVLFVPLGGLLAVRLLAAELGTSAAVWVISLSVLGVTLVLWWLLWRLLLRPVRALAQRAEAIQTGDATATEPLQHYGTRELRDLGQSVLDMAGALHQREQAVRTYTEHVTHELKTPVTAIRGAIELLDDPATTEAEARQLGQTIRNAADRMTVLLGVARAAAAAREPTHAGWCTLEEATAELPQNALAINLSGGAVVMPLAKTGLEIVLKHLLENAGEAGATHVKLTASEEHGQVCLQVSDNGSGIAAGNQDRLFEPYFTTKRESGGTGMGLWIVKELLEAHGAGIAYVPGAPGATFELRFEVAR